MRLALVGMVLCAGTAAADPVGTARDYLAAHVPGEFTLVSDQLDGEIRSIGFEQHWHGLRVDGAQIGFVFGHGHLTAVLPHVRADLHPIPMKRAARGEKLIVGNRVVDRVRDGDVDIFTDDTGEIERRSLRRELVGTLEYNVGTRYASGARTNVGAHTASITANGAATTTNAVGDFTFTGANPANVVASCTGTDVFVANQAGGAATQALSVPANGAAIWSVANVEADDAQVSTYVYGTNAVEKARAMDAAVASWTNPFTFYVNEVNPCNAFSNGDGVHLAKATTECENTGRVADIVYHEFGHSLHTHEVIAGVGLYTNETSEGFADFNAANLTDDPGIGRGLDYSDNAARDIDPVGFERKYPDDVNLDAHVTGLIVSGALWDLRKALVSDLGHDAGVALVEKLFVGILRRSSDLPTTYTTALIADDDDGDLSNGTPHFCAIQRAFGIHGLAPDFADTQIGTPQFADSAFHVPVVVAAPGACPARTVVAMHVLWKIGDGVANDLDLVGGDAEWTAAIPAQADGTTLSYSVDVTLDDGTQIAYPNNPADPMYQVFIGTATPIWCEHFDHDPMWTRTGSNPAEWQWGRPNASGPQSGDPAATHDGTFIYGTNLEGFGTYGAGEDVSATTPTIDTSAFEIIHLQYWRWLTVEASDQAQITASTDTVWKNSTALDHVDREWRFVDLDLTPHLTYSTVAVTWQLATDGTGELGGWNLDDACVVGMAKIPRCGDSYVDRGEECDDGNTFSGDGCSDICEDELEAGGGGGCCSANGGSGSVLLALVTAVLLARTRGASRRDRARRGCRSIRSDRADRSRR